MVIPVVLVVMVVLIVMVVLLVVVVMVVLVAMVVLVVRVVVVVVCMRVKFWCMCCLSDLTLLPGIVIKSVSLYSRCMFFFYIYFSRVEFCDIYIHYYRPLYASLIHCHYSCKTGTNCW